MYWTVSENDPITAPFHNFGKGSQALYRQPHLHRQGIGWIGAGFPKIRYATQPDPPQICRSNSADLGLDQPQLAPARVKAALTTNTFATTPGGRGGGRLQLIVHQAMDERAERLQAIVACVGLVKPQRELG